jgi:predicted GH43/DUF377 family glycosyl hydrolase
MSGLRLMRLGQIMEPTPGDPLEVEGVLNPAAVRGPDGELYLFPRLVATNNYSRIGVARVVFDAKGNPMRVERLGIALEPETEYELRPDGGGGCEEPQLMPDLPEDHHGTLADVVFPTGIDRRDDLGQPNRFDVYYGMGDRSIGVTRLDLPDTLPAGAQNDSPTTTV